MREWRNKIALRMLRDRTVDDIKNPRGWAYLAFRVAVDTPEFWTTLTELIKEKVTATAAKVADENRRLRMQIQWAEARNKFPRFNTGEYFE